MIKYLNNIPVVLIGLLSCCISVVHANDYDEVEFYGKQDGKLVPYVELGIGLGVHVLKGEDEGANSRVIKTSLGIQWLPFISTQMGLWHWSKHNNKSQETGSDEKASNKTEVSFEGVSASWEITLQIPIFSDNTALSYGPYYRVGRHCWSGVGSGFVRPWSREGCSDLHSVGFVFPASDQRAGKTVLFIEASHSNLDTLSTRSVQLGAKLPF